MGRGKRHSSGATTRAKPAPRGKAVPAGKPTGKARKPMLKIQRKVIPKSSLLSSAGYDAPTRILEVEFADGGVYRYFDVPKKIYAGIFADTTRSVGHYFLHEVRPRYEHVCISRSEYKETKEYLAFVRDNLKIDYIDDDVHLRRAIAQIMRSKKPVSIDFETAIESYSDKTRGALRLVQLGISTPRGEKKGRQWVIDCFRVDPTPVIEVFESEEMEKYIHYLFFEEDWATSRFGHSINRIYDTCIAWRAIQGYLTNGMRAAAVAACDPDGNIPRTIRRDFGCTLTRRQLYEGTYNGDWDEYEIDETAIFAADAVLPEDEQEREEALDMEARTNKDVTRIENDLVRKKLPEVPELLKQAGYQVLNLQSKQVLPPLLAAFDAERADFSEDDDRLAHKLVEAACEVWTTPMPTPQDIPEDVEPDERARIEAENVIILAEQQKLIEQRTRTPFYLPVVDRYGYSERGRFYSCVDFDPSKRSSTSFHPNTLAYLTKSLLGFEIPKTEQAGYWGRPELTHKQVIYAAVDVAVLPPIVTKTRTVTDALGISERVEKTRIAASEHRVIERVRDKLDREGYHDHRDSAAQSLRRAKSLDELNRGWDALRQMALVAPSFEYLGALFEERREALGGPASTKPDSKTLLKTPF